MVLDIAIAIGLFALAATLILRKEALISIHVTVPPQPVPVPIPTPEVSAEDIAKMYSEEPSADVAQFYSNMETGLRQLSELLYGKAEPIKKEKEAKHE